MGLTLKVLAQRSGLSAPFLSQVERGQAGISLTSLIRVAEALGVGLPYFVDTTDTQAPIRAPEDLRFFDLEGLTARLARLGSGQADLALEALLVVIPPHTDSESMHHRGEEFIYLLEGQLQLEIGHQKYLLHPGHTAHFQSGLRHRWRNPTDREVRLIWVGTPRLI